MASPEKGNVVYTPRSLGFPSLGIISQIYGKIRKEDESMNSFGGVHAVYDNKIFSFEINPINNSDRDFTVRHLGNIPFGDNIYALEEFLDSITSTIKKFGTRMVFGYSLAEEKISAYGQVLEKFLEKNKNYLLEVRLR